MKLEDFKKLLTKSNFTLEKDVYIKYFKEFECSLKVDLKNELLIYPEDSGLVVNERQTCNFKANENFVVFECVHRLLTQGYNPKHIELEKRFEKIKKDDGGGRADIIVKNNDNQILLIIECKTDGAEFNKHWQKTLQDGDQLFRYLTNKRETQFLCMYASNFIDDDVVSNYRLISLVDNEDYLLNNPKLESFKIAKTKNKEDIFRVWAETYDKEYVSKGLFEKDIAAYKIGKSKFNIDDLKNISSNDIQGKYHEFATILRQHNVSGRENAFDKLVNLFLCKVTDETENKDELKFYWKGKAYDDPFAFQDRLQQLYKKGMEKFLGEDITYIDNTQIDEAFSLFKNKPNTTKEKIQSYFKQLKFFTNNDFAFIDVHNEKLFYQNFEVLLKIARMIQDISLTSSDENQFLGDMFEGFLDQGVKQSEGQFFTPTPIVKFIINSLPNIENPNVIDYACGAGHFLNEYAVINKNAKITGIEKEYRLSKVAKVSSFMYGSDINIIYDDALSFNERIKESSFDVLIANPPYSVKGFLETLSDEDRARFELINTIDEKSFSANNSIECFFIEKAKQLLKTDAVAGIIVPSSILNKGSQSINATKSNVYVATREIILKYFDIVAIAEFGSGTFGKTGTNTVTLFLKRRDTNIDISGHIKNMVDSWFECDFTTNENFTDSTLLEEYCRYLSYDFETYKTLLCDSLDEKLFDYEVFKEYKTEFEKLTDTKNRRNTKTYKALQVEQKEEIEKKELVKYIKSIEKDKLYYFSLAFKNQTDVVIVKAPSDNKESKKFLGYEWSSAKGNEGIKYLSSSKLQVDDENLDEDDKRVLENLSGLKNINTPLYNPNNSEDNTKINKIIKDNFNGVKTPLAKELETYVTRARLVDMLDFTRVEFNKAINLSVDKKVEIKSKYPLVKIESILEKINGNITKIQKDEILESGEYPVITQEQEKFISGYTNNKETITDLPLVVFGDHSCTFKYIDFEFIRGADGTQLLKPNSNFNVKFFYYVLQIVEIENKDKYERHMKYLNSVKIPLPPLDIQEKIVNECQKVDDEVEKAHQTIEQSKKEIESSFLELSSKATQTFRLSNNDIFDVSIGKRVLAKEIEENQTDGAIAVYSANVFEPFGYIKKDLLKDFSKESVIWGIDGDWMVNFIDKNKPFYPTDHCGVIRIKQDAINARYLAMALDKAGIEYRFSRANRASTERIKALNIQAPDIQVQNDFALKVEKLEKQINEAKSVVASAKDKKEEILNSYLQ